MNVIIQMDEREEETSSDFDWTVDNAMIIFIL